MSRVSPLYALLGLWVAGCSSSEVRPASNSGTCIPVDGGAPCRGSPADGILPGLADSASPRDATLDALDSALPTTITGTLRLFPTLPPGMSTTARTNGWTITERPLPNPDAGVTDPLTAITDNLGAFTLAGTPTLGLAPGSGVQSYWLEATFPVMGGIGSLFEIPAGRFDPVLETFDDDTLRSALSVAGIIAADDRAAITVFVRESRAPGARPVQGVVLQADGQASGSLYDGVSGSIEMSVTGTGPLGFAILPNVAVPLSGDGFINVTGARLTRTYSVRVRRRMMSLVLITAS